MSHRKPEQRASGHRRDDRAGHGERGVRPRRPQHHRGGRHRQRRVVVEPAARPELAEVLGEQVERDERHDQHAGPGDDGAGLGAAVDDTAHQHHDPDGLERRDEQQRDPRDPRPRQLRPVHGGQRRQQSGPRRERRGGGAGGPAVPYGRARAGGPALRRHLRGLRGNDARHLAVLPFVSDTHPDTFTVLITPSPVPRWPWPRPRRAPGRHPPGWVWPA